MLKVKLYIQLLVPKNLKHIYILMLNGRCFLNS